MPSIDSEPLAVPADINQCWSTDFISDSLFYGRRFRTFKVRRLQRRSASHLGGSICSSRPYVRTHCDLVGLYGKNQDGEMA
ncbi:MAG: hypothetical protein HOD90_05470 [Nitrospina sp.]|nr:hypothetical protein [Nitrospina sp.]